MGRKPKHKAEPYESAGGYYTLHGRKARGDVSANLYESMLRSDAFKALTDRQKVLFVYCKAQYYGKRKPQRDYPGMEQFQGDDKFYMNLDLAINEYELYPQGSASNFYKDMNALVEHGLIDRISSGQKRRQKSVYGFSDRWKAWKAPQGTD